MLDIEAPTATLSEGFVFWSTINSNYHKKKQKQKQKLSSFRLRIVVRTEQCGYFVDEKLHFLVVLTFLVLYLCGLWDINETTKTKKVRGWCC
jgi:hypothetical protein